MTRAKSRCHGTLSLELDWWGLLDTTANEPRFKLVETQPDTRIPHLHQKLAMRHALMDAVTSVLAPKR